MMTAERWQEIEAILDEVMPLTGAERNARLDQLCNGDPVLRDDVIEMLGYCEEVQNASFLESPPHLAPEDLRMDLMVADWSVADDFAPGASVDAYTIVERLDGGGMGDVYVAERMDPYKRVALKVVKRGMDTREILQRFRYEREILARLEHPNIAQLLDGGVTSDGRPYFVMEYIDGGLPIDRYCDEKGLSVHGRLELFRTVCEAVRYAHRNLVVHRDLKPGNILVSDDETGRPQVKLLDFGIAKLLEDDQLLSTIPMTEAGVRRMTPYYAAPEQVVGGPTTTATDVYALGVILYRLLTGHRPYEFKDRLEIEEIIRFKNPDRPSTVVQRPLRRTDTRTATEEVTVTPEELGRRRAAASPRMLRRQLSGDLDAITLMALRKEPERRYASAAEFLSDVQRYLDNRPVKAQHDTVVYRVGKFVRRHTVGVSITVAMVLLITTLVTGFTLRLAAERDLAEQAAERAVTTRDFMAGTFELANPDAYLNPSEALGESFTKLELIETNLSRIEELSNPLDQAVILDEMGGAYISYGLLDKADSLYRRAWDIKVAALGAQDPDVVESLFGLAVIAQNRPEYEKAVQYYHRILDILDKESAGSSARILKVQNNLAWVLHRQRKVEEAEQWYRNALTLGRAYEKENPDDRDIRLEIAESLSGLADLSRRQHRLDEAEQLFREALDIRVAELGENHTKTANTIYGLADCLKDKGDLVDAEKYHLQALAIYRQAYGDQHRAVAGSLQALGLLNYEMKDFREAELFFRQAIDVYEKAVGTTFLWRAYPEYSLGQLLMEKGDAVHAAPFLRESLEIFSVNGLDETDWRVIRGMNRLGVCLGTMKRYDEAERMLLDSYRLFIDQPNVQEADRSGRTKAMLKDLVTLYEAWQKPEKAAEYRARLDSVALKTIPEAD